MISLPPSLPGPMVLGKDDSLKRFSEEFPRLEDLPPSAITAGIPFVVSGFVPDNEIWLYRGFGKGVLKIKLGAK